VISPDLQNEKKLVVEAAHSMIDLWGFPDWNHTAFILRSMAGVIGSLARAALPIRLIFLSGFGVAGACDLIQDP